MSDVPNASTDPLATAVRSLPGRLLQPQQGDTIYRQDEAGEHLFLIVAGYIKLTQLDRDGAERIAGILDSDELFGLCGENGAREHNAIAKGQTCLYCVAQRDFRGLMEDRSDLVWPVVESLTRRQRLAERRLQALLAQDVRGRIATALHDLVAHYGGRCRHGHEIDVPLTQQEVAEMVGASRPVVSAVLNEWRRDNLLSYTRNYICVNDLAALRDLSMVSSS